MDTRLPPLTALRAFEAAARHMSFQDAAHELNVTPAALSFQIKSLETHLGQPVFHRLNRAVRLTAAGEALAPGVSDGFTRLMQAWQAARKLGDDRTLTVTAGPAFTTIWLAPRLYGFAELHPEIDLRLSASLRLSEFGREDVDAAIRFGAVDRQDDGLFSAPLMDEWLTPVYAPALAETYPTPASLVDAPLIFDDSIGFLGAAPNWATWFAAGGIATDDIHGTHFSNADHAIEAALAGGGILLARMSLAAKAVLAGQLLAPFKLGLQVAAGFRFVCPLGAQDRPAISAFHAWIRRETDVVTALKDGHDLVSS